MVETSGVFCIRFLHQVQHSCKPDKTQMVSQASAQLQLASRTRCRTSLSHNVYMSHYNTEMGQQLKIRQTTNILQTPDTATNSFQTTDNATWRERQLAKPCIPFLASDTHMIRSRTACACLRCAPITRLNEKAVVQNICPIS